jgi:hypothetical protein
VFGVAVPAFTVKVEVTEPLDGGVTEAWLNEQLAPVGQPVTVRLTALLNPFCEVTVTVLVPLFPCITVTLLGDAERLKFGWAIAFTVSLTVVVCVKPGDVPVIVIV